jgi:hypothetical protein
MTTQGWGGTWPLLILPGPPFPPSRNLPNGAWLGSLVLSEFCRVLCGEPRPAVLALPLMQTTRSHMSHNTGPSSALTTSRPRRRTEERQRKGWKEGIAASSDTKTGDNTASVVNHRHLALDSGEIEAAQRRDSTVVLGRQEEDLHRASKADLLGGVGTASSELLTLGARQGRQRQG